MTYIHRRKYLVLLRRLRQCCEVGKSGLVERGVAARVDELKEQFEGRGGFGERDDLVARGYFRRREPLRVCLQVGAVNTEEDPVARLEDHVCVGRVD